jgi:hypothetical protein
MVHYAATDISLRWSSVCVVDAAGKIIREAKVRSEWEAVVCVFKACRCTPAAINRLDLTA